MRVFAKHFDMSSLMGFNSFIFRSEVSDMLGSNFHLPRFGLINFRNKVDTSTMFCLPSSSIGFILRRSGGAKIRPSIVRFNVVNMVNLFRNRTSHIEKGPLMSIQSLSFKAEGNILIGTQESDKGGLAPILSHKGSTVGAVINNFFQFGLCNHSETIQGQKEIVNGENYGR